MPVEPTMGYEEFVECLLGDRPDVAASPRDPMPAQFAFSQQCPDRLRARTKGLGHRGDG